MDEFLVVANAIAASLEGGKPAVLATIIEREGSGPRQVGVRMAITPDGTAGTIGGGGLEASVITAGAKVLEEKRSRQTRFVMDNDDVNTPAMMCGGRTLVLVAYLEASARSTAFFRNLAQAIQRNTGFIFVTRYDNEGNVGCCLLFPDGTSLSSTAMDGGELDQFRYEAYGLKGITSIPLAGASALLETWQGRPNLYCFGAGHVARPTAHLATSVGFRVTVLDDRPEFATTEHFPDAEVRCIEHFENIFPSLEVNNADAIVIVTRDHRRDYMVLRAALETGAGYIGMIASRRKRELVFNALRQAGVTEDNLSRVHAPIGLEIGAETPEEIAVSIVAELIKERARQRS